MRTVSVALVLVSLVLANPLTPSAAAEPACAETPRPLVVGACAEGGPEGATVAAAPEEYCTVECVEGWTVARADPASEAPVTLDSYSCVGFHVCPAAVASAGASGAEAVASAGYPGMPFFSGSSPAVVASASPDGGADAWVRVLCVQGAALGLVRLTCHTSTLDADADGVALATTAGCHTALGPTACLPAPRADASPDGGASVYVCTLVRYGGAGGCFPVEATVRPTPDGGVSYRVTSVTSSREGTLP